jgi:hypothetical protein
MGERPLFEYHLYSLPRPSTLRDNETKQLALFEPVRVKAEKMYTFDGSKVRVGLEFSNSSEAGLGIPLPKGKIRVMKAGDDGSLEFIGEDKIDHTPKDEKVRAFLGNTFDIVAERIQTSHHQVSRRVNVEDFEITLRNHKSVEVTVLVVEHPQGDWTITESSHPYVKKDALTAEWHLPVPANGESRIKYTVRQQF